MLVFLMKGIYDVTPEMAPRGMILHPKFYEDWYRHSSNIKAFPR
jgi:hypothetical protein